MYLLRVALDKNDNPCFSQLNRVNILQAPLQLRELEAHAPLSIILKGVYREAEAPGTDCTSSSSVKSHKIA